MTRTESDGQRQGRTGRSETAQTFKFWESGELPRNGRVALLAVVVVALIAHATLNWNTRNSSASNLLDLGLFVAISVFAWRPPAAAVALMTGCLVAVAFGIGGPYAFGLAIVSGLVVYTCSGLLAAGYCCIAGALSLVSEFTQQGLASGGSIGTLAIGLASGLTGLGFRKGHAVEQRLWADVDRLTRETTLAIQSERDRIADELHNIIAHDITVVLMHTRALGFIKDPTERRISEQAITEAAAQAMTDIRRMLRVVQEIPGAAGVGARDAGSVLGQIEVVCKELRASGMSVEVTTPKALNVSSSIESTLWHISNECSTNIVKYAPYGAKVDISLMAGGDTVTLRVSNYYPHGEAGNRETANGYGLKRMSERVALLGGTFTAGPDDDGWSVHATLPRT